MAEFKSPNQEPGTERRLLLVLAVTFVILMIFQPLLTKYTKRESPTPESQAAVPATPAPGPSSPASTPGSAPAEVPTGKQATAASETIVENDLYKITFTNQGAQVKSWVLKKYDDDKRRPLELVNTGAQVETQQNGQSAMVTAADKYGYPMSLWTYDEGLRGKLNSALYVTSAAGKLRTPAELTFEYSEGDLAVRKTFRFDESYLVRVETEVLNHGQAIQAYPAWPAGFGDQTVPVSYAATNIVHQFGDKIERLNQKKVSGGTTIQGPFNWAGVADQYFGAVFLPDAPENSTLVSLSSEALIPKNLDKPDFADNVRVKLLGAAVGNGNGRTSGRWFVGPKSIHLLDSIRSTPASGQAIGPDLGTMVDFGFFGIVGKPLFLWLEWTQNRLSSNPKTAWGWAIAILTITINLALLPLRVTSMKSALKMQKIQPLINDIKKRYEKFSLKDPRKAEMNQEISHLFKEHGVNPAGGCLPMFIQLPFLWAFYTMLSVAIELRHAPWLWVKDLSSPDPLHLLPVLIIVSTFGMQKMTPTPGVDQAQARMMNLMMPVMIGAFSWAVAAGLGLYWLVGTLIGIGTQVGLNRSALGAEMRAIAEKRARRRETRK